MALAGKYELVREEGFAEHMTAAGAPEEYVKKSLAQKTLEIIVDGDQVEMIHENGPNFKFNLKQVTEDKTGGGVMKSTTSLNGNILTIETEAPNGQFTRVYTLEGSELTVVSRKSGTPEGKRIFKKL